MDISYSIETSADKRIWYERAIFKKGQRSRFNDAPFDEQIALKEANSFKVCTDKDFLKDHKYIRVIIEIN